MYIKKKIEHLNNVLKWKSDGIRERKTLDWYSSDSEDNFTNVVKTKDKTTYSYFKTNPIKYEFNNHGFRTPDDFKIATEFEEGDEGIVYLGCSHTAGVGTVWENTWVNIVHEGFDDKCINLGVPAASAGTCYRLLLYYKNVLKIKKVFHYSLLAPRYEFIYDTKNNRRMWDYFGAYLENLKDKKEEFPYDNFILSSFLTNEYRIIDQMKSFMAIRHICDELGIKYYLVTDEMFKIWERDTKEIIDDYIEEHGLTFVNSRDIVHYDTKKHYVLGQYFKKLDSQNKSTNIDFDICGLKN